MNDICHAFDYGGAVLFVIHSRLWSEKEFLPWHSCPLSLTLPPILPPPLTLPPPLPPPFPPLLPICLAPAPPLIPPPPLPLPLPLSLFVLRGLKCDRQNQGCRISNKTKWRLALRPSKQIRFMRVMEVIGDGGDGGDWWRRTQSEVIVGLMSRY